MRARAERLAQTDLVAPLRDDGADRGADATSVNTSTTSDTIQNSVCSIVMTRVSEAVILVTCCALTCIDVISLMLLTSAVRSEAPDEYSMTSTPRVEPVSLSTSPASAR